MTKLLGARMSNDPASAVAALFERDISSGAWAPGMKLPTERQLERDFGVPRNRLRRALRVLEDDGKITRQVGRGSFVCSPPGRTDEASRPRTKRQSVPLQSANLALARGGSIAELTDRIQGASPHDIMEVRMMVEPAAAELAALRATAADLAIIEQFEEFESCR